MARYLLKTPHYLDGNYIDASPEFPVVIEFDDTARKPSRTWEKLPDQDEQERAASVKAAAIVEVPPGPKAVAVAVEPTPPTIRKGGGRRPNDSDLLP